VCAKHTAPALLQKALILTSLWVLLDLLQQKLIARNIAVGKIELHLEHETTRQRRQQRHRASAQQQQQR
jgi:hypothetical protein